MSSNNINKILDQVHQLSGKPVLVQAAPELRTMATVKVARGAAPAHLVLYQPSLSSIRDYLVAFQCGFLIRIFSTAPAERFDLAPSQLGKWDTEKLVMEHVQQMGRDTQLQLRDQMLNGLGIQLRSVPVGLRVDDWISREYPDLQDQQRISVQRQVQDGLTSLRPEVKKIAPEAIYKPSVAMNAAFAAFWSRAWGDATWTTPYKATGYLGLGEVLLSTWDRIPFGAEHDHLLIESWASDLGLRDWFSFVPGPND